MINSSSLFLGLLFGAIGMGYLIYGMRQRRAVVLICGAVLCALPYAVSNILFLILLGALIMVVPIFYKL
jgi:hypothetical protein